MAHYEKKCEICGDVVYSYDYPNNSYELKEYNQKVHKPFEERYIAIPEQKHKIKILLCRDCNDKEELLNKVILKKRIEICKDLIKKKKSAIDYKLTVVEDIETVNR